jgi:formylglycine-generating enzyme required for sulfatase activity
VRGWLRGAGAQATSLLDEDGRPRSVNRPSAQRALVNSLGMRLVYIPAGDFLMGSPSGEPDRAADEPEHAVQLTHGYYLAAAPVTQAQWWSLMRDRPSRFKGDNLPVESITWHDAVEFCQRLTRLESSWRARLFPGSPGLRRYRLPTEAEWEYAARAGRRRAFATGHTLGAHEANCDGGSALTGHAASRLRGRTTEVGAFCANAWGLYDVHGNVAEWCQDRYAAYPYGPCIDPAGPDEGVFRVTRGGSWASPPRDCRSAARDRRMPDQAHETVGFRVALDLRD